jgi:tetratricopeptide (TPR) repeat protein
MPNDSVTPYRLGLVARAEKDNVKALAYFEDALAKKPAAVEPLTQIAMIKIVNGKPNEARERVLRQLEFSPGNPSIYILLGQILVLGKDGDRAEAAFKKAIELDNSLLQAYMSLGQVYFQAGKLDQAVKEYEAVLAKDPKAIQAHMMLGIIDASRKDYDKAKSRYERILNINPVFAPAANNLAWILTEQGGNIDMALSYAQTAREQKPDDPYVADTLGWIYYKKGAYLLAASLLKEAVDKLPNEPVIHFHMGMTLQKNGDKAGAKKSLQLALKLSQTFIGSEDARKVLAAL